MSRLQLSNINKTNASLLATTAFLVLCSTGFAYGEKSTIDVPFTSHGHSCWLESATIYTCVWEGHIEVFSIEDLEQYHDILTPEQYEAELEKLTVEPTVVEFVDERTPEEKLIDELQLKLYRGEADATEATHLRLLKQLAECQRGLGNSAAVQDRTSFVISEFTHGKYNNIEIKGQIGSLLKSIQECRAQNTLEHYVLSAADGNFAKADANDVGNLDHLAAWKGIQAIDYELYTKNSDRLDLDPICDSWLFADTHKVQMGCKDVYEYTGKTNVNPKGYITYYSDANTQYQKYLLENSRYATNQDKLEQESIAKPILQEMLEENPWYEGETP
jgi:hypothetical protein